MHMEFFFYFLKCVWVFLRVRGVSKAEAVKSSEGEQSC